MRGPTKDLSIFDFKADEPNKADEKLSKYHFLESFTTGSFPLKQPDLSDLPLIDLHEVGSPVRFTPGRNVASAEEKSELDDFKACSRSYHKHTKICNSDFRPESFVQEGLVMATSTNLVDSAYDDEDSELQSSVVPLNLMSEEEENFTSASEDSSISGDFPESDGLPECAGELCHAACEKMVSFF
ncbi:uncharacterized protein LOC110105661 [Dendrobium catenatum]|uniref:uncharacterized protein LOC110105661 n=1 Tax=Dendrobium catenatum TaxID=906689 RepID=UPI0009F3DFE0|nr:uncharacterized protein LOC110105661 [Dendrobium catenatum]XP_020690915.1 uncharacterized protein LOC110105661 [Dendrobium catenatum]XP_028551575.1 uncharacterized protein LOC110105661 [Dendrobium catenatum]